MILAAARCWPELWQPLTLQDVSRELEARVYFGYLHGRQARCFCHLIRMTLEAKLLQLVGVHLHREMPGLSGDRRGAPRHWHHDINNTSHWGSRSLECCGSALAACEQL